MHPHHLVKLFFSALNKSNENGINYSILTHTQMQKENYKHRAAEFCFRKYCTNSFYSGICCQFLFFSAISLNWDKPELADVLITAPFCISNTVHLHKWRHILFSLSSCTTPFLHSVQKRKEKKKTQTGFFFPWQKPKLKLVMTCESKL